MILCTGSNTASNATDTPQTISVALTETTTTTRTLEYTLGITVTAETEISAGYAMLAEGKITISAAVKNEWKWGKTDTDTKTFTTTLNVAAKPWSEVTAIATATKSDIELPFTITWKSKKTGYEVKTQGVYKGTNYWNTKTKFKPGEDGEDRELDPESQEWQEIEPIERVENVAGDEERSLDDGKWFYDTYSRSTRHIDS